MTLYEKTLKLINETDLTLLKVSQDCGVSYRWVMSFKSGEAPGAAINRVQRVHDYLIAQSQANECKHHTDAQASNEGYLN